MDPIQEFLAKIFMEGPQKRRQPDPLSLVELCLATIVGGLASVLTCYTRQFLCFMVWCSPRGDLLQRRIVGP